MNDEVDLVIERKKRKTLSIVIKPDGKVLVLAPLKSSDKWIQQILDEKKPWIDKHILKAQKRQTVPLDVYVLGKKLTEVQLAQKNMLLQEAKKYALQLLNTKWFVINAGQLSSVPILKFRKMKTRWGTYHSKGVVTLNAQLLHFPWTCIEYVIVHELCHAFHANHGPQFYALMTSHLPDWKIRKKALSHFVETGEVLAGGTEKFA